MQAERGFAGRRAADARLLVPDTPPAVFAAAPDDHAVIPNTVFLTTVLLTTVLLITVFLTAGALTAGALSADAGAGGFRATRPVQPPVDDANS
jgi:hypothetical protein